MSNEQDPCPWTASAASYAAGALSSGEFEAFESHLSTDCRACLHELRRLDSVVAALLDSASPVDPSEHTREQLMDRIRRSSSEMPQESNVQVWKTWQREPINHDIVIRDALTTGWEDIGIEGIQVRRLNVDHELNRVTMLVRMEAGTSYPGHDHGGAEECLVLEGTLRAGDRIFRAGDYQRMAEGTRHGIQSTDDGCLLMIISSTTDRMVDKESN